MILKRLRLIAVLTVVLSTAGVCSRALADGDPASDVLLTQEAFFPSDSGLSTAQQNQLNALLRATSRAGYPVRVAIIANSYDLGSITVLWRKPEDYARFLGAELGMVYKHALVTVMPNGVGINLPGHSVASETKLAAAMPAVRPGAAGLLAAASGTVDHLLAMAHVKLPPVSATVPAPRGKGGGQATGVLALIIAAALAVILTAGLAARGRLRRPASRPEPQPPPARRPRGRPAWALPAIGIVFGLAIAAPIAALAILRRQPSTNSSDVAQPSAGTPYTLPAGHQRAPNFTLRDQNGRRFSLASYRGRDVFVTFVDPLCRNLCPLEAHVLNELVDSLPARQRPEIIAVSVDIYADTRPDLLQDFSRWSLVPQWRWGVGSHAALASIWKRYAVEVDTVTKHLAGTTVHYITHTEAAYLIDAAGYERALFAWPFTPQDVLATLHRLAHT